MQASWENNDCIFVDIDPDSKYQFGCRAIFDAIRDSGNGVKHIFHAQSSLHYLIFALIINCFFRNKRLIFIYDIHDFHEFPNSTKARLRHVKAIVRYVFFYVLEYIICNLSFVRKITVSPGLASLITRKYSCTKVFVVRNISIKGCKSRFESITQAGKDLVYFGIFNHLSFDFLKRLSDVGFFIDIYGRGDDIFLDDIKNILGVRYRGEYSSSDMSFLLSYRACILFNKLNILNNQIALPNKLYQSLYSGLPLIVSENFSEIISGFDDFPDFIFEMKFSSDILGVVEWLDANEKFHLSQSRVRELQLKIRSQIAQDMNTYLSL